MICTPRTSVRALLAVLIVIATIFTLFYDKDVFHSILPVTSLVIGFYFGKSNE